MFLTSDNPVYNTIIVFTVIMALLYITKPNVIYDNNKKEFRQFGTTNGKTILPIYVIGILLSIILYVFFHYLALNNKKNNIEIKEKIINDKNQDKTITQHNGTEKYDDRYNYILQQQQLQYIQNQMNHMNHMNHIIQNQLNQQIQNQMSQQIQNVNDKIIDRIETKTVHQSQQSHQSQQTYQQNMSRPETFVNKENAVLPNCFNV